jgi:hypothetical protein
MIFVPDAFVARIARKPPPTMLLFQVLERYIAVPDAYAVAEAF